MSDVILERVRKDFGATTAVEDLDLHVASGESVVLLGPSGCGKTTTLRMVAGFERPTDGTIGIGGQAVAGPGVFVPPERRQIGVVFQSYALWPHMTTAANVGFGLTVGPRGARPDRAEVRRRVDAALDQVQLSGMGSRYPHELSGGQQQRVALARALVTEPAVLLLDEPLSNLDTRLREEMRGQIRSLQRRLGITMIYITHDRTEALGLGDRIVALREGRVQQVGSPRQLYRNPATPFVARSLGAANVLPCTVVDGPAPEGMVAVRLSTGQLLDAADPGDDGRRRAGDALQVCVRPPDIVAERATSADGRHATVVDSTFLGDELHHVVELPGVPERCRVVERGDVTFEAGTPVSLTVAASAASVVGADPAADGSAEPAPDPVASVPAP